MAANWNASVDQRLCSEEPMWPVSLGLTIISPMILYIFLGLWRLGNLICNHGKKLKSRNNNGHVARDVPFIIAQTDSDLDEANWTGKVRHFCDYIMSGRHFGGKLLLTMEFFAGITSLFIYFNEVSRPINDVEICGNWYARVNWQVDLACNLFLLATFVIRFIAASEKTYFLLGIHAIMAYSTIPPSILTMVYNKYWIGLRCLRAGHLLSVPDILQTFRLVQRRTLSRLIQVLCGLLVVLLITGGIFHMLENTGDRWLTNPRVHSMSYWEGVYFAVFTINTVGYGDINPESTLGRLFCCLFMLWTFSYFTTIAPEIYAFLVQRQKHRGVSVLERGVRYIVVRGDACAEVMLRYLRYFEYYNIEGKKYTLVFVGAKTPDVEAELVIKRSFGQLIYLQGSLMNIDDLHRANIRKAAVCLFPAFLNSKNATSSDIATVMEVTSVKNFSPHTRCVVTLIESRLKYALNSIPNFTKNNGDSLICHHELKFGLLGQSCLSPGVSTLLTNLMRPSFENCHSKESDDLSKLYTRGSSMMFHVKEFSKHFSGMSFLEAAECCYQKLELVLIGVRSSHGDLSVYLCPFSIVIESDHFGIFISSSVEQVEKVKNYCPSQYKSQINGDTITNPCDCSKGVRIVKYKKEEILPVTISIDSDTVSVSPQSEKSPLLEHDAHVVQQNNHINTAQKDVVLPETRNTSPSLRFAGDLHEFAIMTRNSAAGIPFLNHFVILILAKLEDPPIGLNRLISSILSNDAQSGEIRDVVILGDPEFLKREWDSIAHFPNIHLVKGDPVNRNDLLSVSIQKSVCCVILSSCASDKESSCGEEPQILVYLSVKAILKEFSYENSQKVIPVLTEIHDDSSIRLLDNLHSTQLDSYPLSVSRSFKGGEIILQSCFDSLLITSYFCSSIVDILEQLVFRHASDSTVRNPAKGVSSNSYSQNRAGVRLKLVSMADLLALFPFVEYGQMFVEALKVRFVCLGVATAASALHDYETHGHSPKNIVLTNPPPDYVFKPNDLVYILTTS